MLNSQETLTIVERMLERYDSLSLSTQSNSLSNEEKLLLDNLLESYDAKNDLKFSLILKIFLSYFNLFSSNRKIDKNFYQELIDILKSVRFNEIELFLPCKNIEWVLLEIGKQLLTISNEDASITSIVGDILETATDLFKIVDNDYGLAITNYLLAYKWFLAGNKEKASRLLEMVAHIFKSPVLILESQYYAALMNYPINLHRSINLLENCLLLSQKYSAELAESTISHDELEETLNKLRREYIIRDHEADEKAYLFKVIDNVIHYYYNKNDLFGLSACYYEAGIIFDKLGYEDTAEEYFVESAIITSDLQQWKLYSKALINLVIKFFEKGRIREAEDYLNDLIQVASFLKDEGLHKKVETLLISLKKLKEIKPAHITAESKIEEYISEIDSTSQIVPNTYEQSQKESSEHQTNLDPSEEIDLLNSLEILSNYNPEQNSIPEQQINENIKTNEQVSIDQNFLMEFKEPIIDQKANEVIISNENLLTPTPVLSEPETQELSSFHSVRKGICSVLKNNNFEVFTDYKPVKGSVTVDIVAIRGKIRRQKLFIMIAGEGEGEIELSLNLLISIFDTAERIIFVNTRNKKDPIKKGGVIIIYDINDLPI